MTRTATRLASVVLTAVLAAAALAAEPVLVDRSLLDAFAVRPLGPANMGGRITDVAVVESKPSVMYVGAASGGVWKTTDGGDTWTPIFDTLSTSWIGDIAVAPSDPDVVWVGSGESNPRNSVSWGDGVYKSIDGGKTWKNMGLKETHHIGRVVIHPKNPDVVWVAALGHFWAPNKERGLYKTTDGGKTWEKALYLDDETGIVDVALDPTSPDILYAATYHVRRDGFAGGNPAVQTGPKTGLFRTEDGGKTWEKMTNGLPDRPLGRCGLDVYRKDPRVVYAVIQTDKTSTSVQGQPGKTNDNPETSGPNHLQGLAAGTVTSFATPSLAAGVTQFLLVKRLQSAQAVLDTGGVFRSDDKGKSWTKLNDLCPRPFYYGQIRIDPNDDKRLYVLGISFQVSNDGGRTFPNNLGARGVHPDHHALWIDPRDSDHLVLGNDGGLYFSKNKGKDWDAVRGLSVGQFYAVAADPRKPYHVYGGLQDNGSWGGPSATHSSAGITLADWKRIAGADGFYCQADPTDWTTVYAEGQYGALQRINVKGNNPASKNIKPQPATKDTPAYRFNWSSPVLLSPHDNKTLYYGGNFLFKSTDRGDKWETISPDLTRGKPGPDPSTGHTLTTIAESPVTAGILWVGTDDGKVQGTRDGGKEWADVSEKIPDVPQERWITRVECSHADEGTAYVTIDRHRNDDLKPYVFKTTDFGATWKPLANNLPAEGPVHVIRESSKNKDLLFAGTEFGLFVSLDGGAKWNKFGQGLPTVPVHDLLIHPRDRELVIGTHGRGMYVLDVAPLEELTPKVLAADSHLFEIKPAVAYKVRDPEKAPSARDYKAPNPPYGATVWYSLKTASDKPVTLTVADSAGKSVATLTGPKEAGLHPVVWNLRPTGDTADLVEPGDYTVTLKAGNRELSQKVKVEPEEKE